MRAGLFPGQGVDAAAVLAALDDAPLLERANELTGTDLTRAVSRCLERTRPVLPTEIAQPALLVAGLAAHDRQGPFDLYAGHSVGEYAALAAAGAFTHEDALRLVCLRGRAMRDAARAASAGRSKEPGASGGGMAAVKGISRADIEAACVRSGAVIANDNSPAQLVVSGPDESLAEIARIVREAGGRCLLLPVEGAYHSPAMTPAATTLQGALDRVEIRMPRARVVSNVTARPYRAPGEIRSLLVRQLTERVRFRESVEWLARAGATELVDLGPGRVAGKLADATLKVAVGA